MHALSSWTSNPDEHQAAHDKMFFVDTFVDAALAAHSVKLLNGCGVVNVARTAWQTYCGIKPSASVEKVWQVILLAPS